MIVHKARQSIPLGTEVRMERTKTQIGLAVWLLGLEPMGTEDQEVVLNHSKLGGKTHKGSVLHKEL